MPCLTRHFMPSSYGRAASSGVRIEIVPMGEVSVMPQPWTTSMSNSSWKARIRLSGTAEPPIITRLTVGMVRLFSRRCVSSICQTVGTAAEKVTPSDTINS